jgi:4-amino-4-deoxy-L-arabinose transferase-like glycosyltransferase
VSFRRFVCFLGALVPVYVALAALVPPFDDELYYWCWSRDLQLSYYDHPPMVAYVIRGATELFGNSVFAMRLPAVMSAVVVAGVIGWLSKSRDLMPLVLLSPVLTFAAVLVTPDTPMMMFWALYLVWLVTVHERLDDRVSLRMWILGGVLLGCGLLGKYTTGLAAVAGGVGFLVAGNARRWAAGYALHAAVAALVASPILIHNLKTDFAPLRYQWGHSMSSPAPGLGPFAEFVGVQLLLFGALPAVVFVWAIRHREELLADPRMRVCLCLFALPLAFFLVKATRGRVEGNWAFPCYLACWPLAAEWYRRVRESARMRLVARGCFVLPLGVSLFFAVHLFEPVPLLPAAADRPSRQREKMVIARQLAADLRSAGYGGPVYAPTYQWTAVLRWHGIDARQIVGASRPSHFTERPELCGEIDGALVFTEAPAVPADFLGCGPPRSAVCYPLVVRGLPRESCWLLDYSGQDGTGDRVDLAAGPARLDPHPPHPPR